MAFNKAGFIFLLMAVKFSLQIPILDKPEPRLVPGDYRLNNDVVPINYNILLNLAEDFVTSRKFIAVVEISLKVHGEQDSEKQITLNAKYIKLLDKDQITLNKKGEMLTNLLDTNNIEENTVLERIVFLLKAGKKLIANEEYILRIPYEGELHQDMYGFYLSSYKDNSDGEEVEEWLATTQFQPTHARRAFPCFDEPEYKATFEIIITHPLKYQALSNAAIKTRVHVGKSQTTIFEKTPAMSSYIVAFVVCKFKSIYEFNEHVRENKAWAQPLLVDLSKYAHNIGPKVIEKLNDYTGLEYSRFSSPIHKLDQIAIPDFSAGAMENWGLVTYKEPALLYDKNECERRQKQRVAAIVAHELAHMWFGNLVTCKWWSSTWLNEGFASYFEYFIIEEVEKNWEMDKQFVIEQQRSILIGDAFQNSQPLTMDEDGILTPAQIRSRFGSITYSKGASIIRMMANFLGKEVFQAGIRKYLQTNQKINTVPDDLWTAFDASERLPPETTLKTVMESWTQQSGYPVINVDTTLGGKDIILSQKRFLFNKVEKNEKKKKEMWYIPITYTTSENPKFENTNHQEWLMPEAPLRLKDVIQDPSTPWLILNIKDSAYYRVNYGEHLWENLRNHALTKENLKKVDELNRAQIIDDVLNLARAGQTNYDTALTVASYLEHDTSYYPWYSAFNAFTYLRLVLDPEDKVAPLLNLYIRMLMELLYKSVSFDGDEKSQIETYKKVLTLTWACELGEEGCIEKSKELFDLFRTTNQKIRPDLRKVVYCTAIQNSNGRENWDFLRQQLSTTKLPSEIATIISALGCSTNKATLTGYLEESVSPTSDIPPQSRQSVYTAVISGNPVGFKTAFSFLQSRVVDIKEHYGGINALSSVMTTTAGRLTTLDQIDKFESFIEENQKILEEAAQVGRDAIVQANENVVWADKYKNDLYKYLEIAVSTPNPPTSPLTTPSKTPSITASTEPPTTTTTEPTTTKDPNSGTSLTVCNTLLVMSISKAVFRF